MIVHFQKEWKPRARVGCAFIYEEELQSDRLGGARSIYFQFRAHPNNPITERALLSSEVSTIFESGLFILLNEEKP